ncbi:hypothetical protein BCR44DRAFT_1504886 [Catenaria anguillulae PL171]|uniref:N-acetyltransferase domain-containing protein n=1 Tax=Catenaria anguillulae PL171 TaxID=765915 RepID=A0A1Y2H716_9FUNG|nr:hypothetical protein BCR44DRAFT_1504886 [Catenaria anguillulae PL171]
MVQSSDLPPTREPSLISDANPAAAESLANLPQLFWRDSVIITPLTRSLSDFFLATRLVTWDAHAVESSFMHQNAGSRLLFALWIPENDWLTSIASYESKHGKGQGKMYAIDDEEWIHFDLHSTCPAVLDPAGVKYLPVATIAVDFDNLTYDLQKDFGGNEALMKASCACRETHVGYICMLAVLPQFQGRGYARDCMDFAEEWVLRRGWTCEDVSEVDGVASGVQQWLQSSKGQEIAASPIPRRLPPCRAIALVTEARNKKNNQFYQRRGYKETHMARQDGWTARFYVKEL